MLSVLCGHPEIAKGEVVFLAPTGKARVRMEQAAKDQGLRIQMRITRFAAGRSTGTGWRRVERRRGPGDPERSGPCWRTRCQFSPESS
ncbi:MAG: hypothetical protein JNJ76_05510 [Candidatus Competibacter sp.]|nr:hypothetical protein [Candidatus Competibacter sp.]